MYKEIKISSSGVFVMFLEVIAERNITSMEDILHIETK